MSWMQLMASTLDDELDAVGVGQDPLSWNGVQRDDIVVCRVDTQSWYWNVANNVIT